MGLYQYEREEKKLVVVFSRYRGGQKEVQKYSRSCLLVISTQRKITLKVNIYSLTVITVIGGNCMGVEMTQLLTTYKPPLEEEKSLKLLWGKKKHKCRKSCSDAIMMKPSMPKGSERS